MRFDEAGVALVCLRATCFEMHLNFARTLLREGYLWLGDHEQLYHEIHFYIPGDYISVESPLGPLGFNSPNIAQRHALP